MAQAAQSVGDWQGQIPPAARVLTEEFRNANRDMTLDHVLQAGPGPDPDLPSGP